MRADRLRLIGMALWLFVSSFAYASSYSSHCQNIQTKEHSRPLTIAVRFSPPFIYEASVATQKNGGWEGIAIDLWSTIAECLNTSYRFKEYVDDENLLSALKQGDVDIALGAFVPTAEHERIVDFTHSYFQGHIGVMVAKESGWANLYRLVQNFPLMETFFVLLILLLVMIATALLYWQAEQKNLNPLFTDGPLKGFYNAMIWSTVLVFSGQGSPFEVKHRGGQVLVIILMFFGVSFVSIVTALLTSALTLQGLGAQITSVDELAHKNVAYLNMLNSDLRGETIAEWLQDNNVTDSEQLFSWTQVMSALQEGRLEAIVHSKEEMQYLVKSGYLKEVSVLPITLEQTDYSLILPDGSPMTELLNRQILETVHNSTWHRRLERYVD
ncbi:transporter substrate-binding domain-containing protein [Marinomonas mediterranea]|uniref:transporter substrate-binding domain-containing protein n=1 Tax=Marinomonas mediterranea TaxID=119864 RepID=UPI002349DA2C|nr:transporter substrate-binding domain-containing protein [Marinomonas mediterranea]WCN09836.1 transporter substrate-binding domain-containing protein [Marinomonas mediterranea]